MFDKAKAAGLQPTDIAKLLGITRVTARFWLKGRNQPHHLIHSRVVRLLDAVAQCVQTGSFPVPRDVSRRERGLYVRNALAACGWKDNSDN
jgi:hypothetical protein